MRKTSKAAILIAFAILLLISVTTVFPFYFMFVSMFKNQMEFMTGMLSIPSNFNFDNILNLFDKFNVLRMVFNSLFIITTSCFVSIIFSSMAGTVFAKFPFKGSDTIFFIIITSMMIPGIVLLIPLYQVMSKLGLINNHLSLIIWYVTSSLAFSIYLITQNLRAVPGEIIESATIDGAGLVRVYYKIILPMAKPAILTLITLNFMGYWNEFLYSMVLLQNDSVRTLTVGVATIVGRFTANMPLLMTGLFINSIPVIIVFIAGQKYFIKGLTVGAIK